MAERVVKYLGLPCDLVHLDSTSFHVDAEYQLDIDAQHIRLTQGYSRDHRPELNQVILNLITENQAGLPVYRQGCSGNTNDSESFKKLVEAKSILSAYSPDKFIAIEAGYSGTWYESNYGSVPQKWLLVKSE